MTKAREQKIMDKFKLTDAEIEQVKRTAIQLLKHGKKPSKDPIAIIVGGQSGSGKTSLMAFANREFPNGILIDNDTLRALHPKAEEIRRYYPEFYTQATDQIGMGITAAIVDYFMGNNPEGVKYDIIFHQTLKNNRIADDAMTKFHNAGYTVGVKVFAVSYFESKMSQIERCIAQYQTMGFCRYVDPQAHFDAISGVPFTIDYIEQTGKYDVLQVYMRSNDINNPTLIYTSLNSKSKRQTRKTYASHNASLPEEDTSVYIDGKDAVIKGRAQDALRCYHGLVKRLDKAKKMGAMNIPGMAIHIEELESHLGEFAKLLAKGKCPCKEEM